jgi:hypothetical protein
VLFVLRWFVSAKVMLVTLEKSQLYHSSSWCFLFEVVGLQTR